MARFLVSGHNVKAYDPSARALEKLKKDVKNALSSLKKIGLNKNASLKNLKCCSSIKSAIKNADFIQENAPENEKIKTKLLKQIDSLSKKNVVIASSSSGLLPSKIQSQCKYPQRVLIGHPFNPVYLLPLVEVVGGKKLLKLILKKP